MKTIGIRINIVLEVEDDVAERFKKCPPGFLKLGEEILGDEKLTVAPVNEEGVEPADINIKLHDLSALTKAGFLNG